MVHGYHEALRLAIPFEGDGVEPVMRWVHVASIYLGTKLVLKERLWALTMYHIHTWTLWVNQLGFGTFHVFGGWGV